MAVSTKFVLQQGPVLRGMGEAALAALRQRMGWSQPREVATPGPEHRVTLPPRPDELLRAYLRHVGGDPSWYRGQVPAHLFPQWTFGLSGRLMEGLKYPLLAAMNGGCRLTFNAPLPAGEPLEVSGRLESIDDDGRRAIIDQRFTTGTRSAPDAVVAHLFVFVPLGKGQKAEGKGNGSAAAVKEKARVPEGVRELGYWKLRSDAGLDFAKLTGDFNPVHWIPPYARAFGFRSTILHGFATLARTIEGMNRALFAGDVSRLKEIEVRFTRPLVLPARVGLYVRDDRVWVGDAPGGPAYLEGRFTLRSDPTA